MIEKTDHTALATAATMAAASPLLGDFAVIAVAAVFGAFVAASRLVEPSRLATAWFIFRSVSITTFSAGAAAQALGSEWFAQKTGMTFGHSVEILAFIAFWIAVIGDGWFKLKDRLLSRIERWLHAGTH
ncbi:MAG: hypothetical protein WC551_10875 [Patescibacteria group bacterium]